MTEHEPTRVDPARKDTELAHASSDTPEIVLPEERVVEVERERRYTNEGLLGEGGMGAVLLCTDRQIGRRVAMKVIRADHRASRRAETRFVREARVQGQLEHPAVVPVYDLGVDPEGAIYFTMKRVRGDTLGDILARPAGEGAYSRHKLLSALARVCLAVDFAHRRGVLHRDLKPANVMLGDYGEVYVLDWGLAKLRDAPELDDDDEDRVAVDLSGETAPGAILGTPGYMSPEQLRPGDEGVGRAADVYSLGAILFELLTGAPLHDRSSMASVIASTLEGVEARPSVRAPEADVAPELEAICVRATALEPADRFVSARDLHDSLERYLEGERDVELRRQMAKEHAERALAAEERERSGEGDLEERRTAMREIGRALALDPSEETALTAMMRLLTTPPREVPPEVREEMQRSSHDQNRVTGRIGAVAYASLFLYLPVLLWLGVRDPVPLVVLYVAAALTTGVSVWVVRQRRPPVAGVLLAMILSNVAFGATTAFYGPLMLVPPIAVANTISFAIHLDRWHRWLAVGCGCLVLLVPMALEALGILPPSYSFVNGDLVVHAHGLELREGPTTLFLGIISVAAVITGSVVVGGVRNALREAEERLYLYAWHLREFVPQAARPATDPTRARRTKPPAR